MINAALKVFARNGYRHASTDDIVAEAGISKGLLFHYFTSKLGLYTFLYDYSIRFMSLELSTGVAKEETDFFILLKQIEAAKMQVLRNYPYMQQFIDSARYEDVKEALLAIEEKKNYLSDVREQVMRRADLSKLRKEANPEKLVLIAEYTIQGMMSQHFLEDSFQPDMVNEEISGYLDMLEQLSYL